MAKLQTLCGPIDTSEMGRSLLHEHVLWQFDDSHRKESIEFQVNLLRQAHAAGIQTVVDLTPWRRIDWLEEIASQVQVHIVASTGYYLEKRTPAPLAALSESQMADRMVLELRDKIPEREIVLGDRGLAAPKRKQLFSELLSALMNLGYKKKEAETAIDKALASAGGDETDDLEILLRTALRMLMKE